MKVKLLPSILSGQEQSLAEVWGWFEFQEGLIRDEEIRALVLLSSGAVLPTSP
jgi:hypothetical protein